MSEIKTLKEKYRACYIQIRYKILKVKDLYEEVLKKLLVLTKVLNKGVKSVKKLFQELKYVRKSPPAKNPHHAETSQSTRNASKLTGCNKTQVQNQRRPQNRPEFYTYLLFLKIN